MRRGGIVAPCHVLAWLLVFSWWTPLAASLEPVPSLEKPGAIDEEIAQVRDRTRFIQSLVEENLVEQDARERSLIDQENSPLDAGFTIASVRAARSELDGIETRISTVVARREQVSQRLASVEQAADIAGRREEATRSLRGVVREVGLQRMGRLVQALEALVGAYDEALDLLNGAAELARDRLELVQSRLQVAEFDETAEIENDVRIQLAARLIDSLLDRGLRLRQDASRIERSDQAAAARLTELEYAGEASIIRSNLRLRDLELFRLEARQNAVASISADPDMPVRVLRATERELDALDARLAATSVEARAEARRLRSMDAAVRRRLETTGEPIDALTQARAAIVNLQQLIKLQLADFEMRAEALDGTRAGLDDRIGEAESAVLARRIELPSGVSGWQRAGLNVLSLPAIGIAAIEQGATNIVQAGSSLAGFLAIAALVIATAFAMSKLRPLSIEAQGHPRDVGRALVACTWLLPPALAWIGIAAVGGLPLTTAICGFGLLLMPAGLVAARSLHWATDLDGATRITSIIALAAIGVWLFTKPLPIAPALADLLDRVSLLALASLALLALVHVAPATDARSRSQLRLPLIGRVSSTVSVYAVRMVAIAVILTALAGLAGYTPAAGTILQRLAGAIAAVVGVVLALVAIRRLALWATLALKGRSPTTARFWRHGVVRPCERILVVVALLAGLQAFAILFDRELLPPQFVLIALVLGILPFTLQLFDVLVTHTMAPEQEREGARPTLVRIVLVQRIARSVLIVGTAFAIIALLGISLQALAAPTTMQETVARAALDILVVVLIADLVWQSARTAIVHKEYEASRPEEEGEEAARRRARLRTLLPIVRNILAIVILVTTVLMALSSVGIEIGPLIAGAGVVGVAIGFGAQTLVKDIIAGVFFLLDDAFRIGEYIESGEVRGRVESFSLRSVKLRHHRGPLHTVPFGELGSITNYSRDWVIDKITLTVNPDSDISKIKKLVKQIGKDMLADSELSKSIIEPLKSQGVYAMREDGSVQIRLKITTKPGEQFVVRRTVYDRVKQAFAENGIEFFRPTVQVAEPQQVAAQHAHEAARAARTATPA